MKRRYNRAVGDYDMGKRLTEAILDAERLRDALERIEPLLERARPMPALVIVRQTLYPIPEQKGPT